MSLCSFIIKASSLGCSLSCAVKSSSLCCSPFCALLVFSVTSSCLTCTADSARCGWSSLSRSLNSADCCCCCESDTRDVKSLTSSTASVFTSPPTQHYHHHQIDYFTVRWKTTAPKHDITHIHLRILGIHAALCRVVSWRGRLFTVVRPLLLSQPPAALIVFLVALMVNTIQPPSNTDWQDWTRTEPHCYRNSVCLSHWWFMTRRFNVVHHTIESPDISRFLRPNITVQSSGIDEFFDD